MITQPNNKRPARFRAYQGTHPTLMQLLLKAELGRTYSSLRTVGVPARHTANTGRFLSAGTHDLDRNLTTHSHVSAVGDDIRSDTRRREDEMRLIRMTVTETATYSGNFYVHDDFDITDCDALDEVWSNVRDTNLYFVSLGDRQIDAELVRQR